ncbi:uncharacterized protein LOC110452079 [Mizuhopecten yessoensis]|uniref:Methyltransferase FkbM domain-containing protein n=1 Tax=Mizuhopecten yessoensis TaxID=6573 RepID=A0A210QKK0_MIZYE|nr:uncharacterized protein LOC110452079 [Mizuhopecten yessoensis]OWF49232.1 hypothetical protein KP79_PYT24475 [Mizuhopecten yessoensis]
MKLQLAFYLLILFVLRYFAYFFICQLEESKHVYTEEKYVPMDGNPRYSNPTRNCQSNQSFVDFGSGSLTCEQRTRVEQCIQTYQEEYIRALKEEIADRDIRYTSHSYLDRNSFMIEAGGHRGNDTYEFNSRYHPGFYIVLEPVPVFYDILVKKFQQSPNIAVYNFGIDVKDGNFNISESSDNAVSIFMTDNQKGRRIQIVNTTRFFEKLSVRSREVDLITLNCEGCEYAVLDLLLSTDYIRHFRNIQFQSHRIPGICYPVRRFCWYQELLGKTHKLIFQFKFVWESWARI